MLVPRWLMIILFFGCFGMTTEIWFVAFTNLWNQTPFCNEPLWSLTGKTYVWMFPIYASIPLFAGFLYKKFKHMTPILRWFVYVLVLLAVEFTSGFLLDQFTGKCPWEYTTGWHIAGYIRLDYIPAWYLFAALVEWLYISLDNKYS